MFAFAKSKNEIEKMRLQKRLDYMRSVEMSVIVSEDTDEEKKVHQENEWVKFDVFTGAAAYR